MALLLRRAGTFEAIKILETPLDVSAFLCLGMGGLRVEVSLIQLVSMPGFW